MRKNLWLVGTVAAGMLAAASAVSASASVSVTPAHPTPVLHGSPSGAGDAQGKADGARGGAQPLYPCFYQGPDSSGNAIASQDFGPGNPQNSTGADDFSVTAPCTATTVTAWGQESGGGTVGQVEVDFFSDAGGLPGALVGQTITNNFTDSSGFLTIQLTPVSLLANTTYWVSVQAQTVSGSDIWFWDTALMQGNPAVWQNPGGGFGTGCTTWTSLQTCFGLNSDFAFIIGAAGPSPCYSQTASSYPAVPANSQNWTAPGRRALASDDFTLTGYCKAHTIIVPFRYLKAGSVGGFLVHFCPPTSGGQPPTTFGPPCVTRSASFTIPSPGTDMILTLSSGVALVPGTYWLVIRATGASTWGLWGWDTMPQVAGTSPAVWRNGGYWSIPCIGGAWHTLAGCIPGADSDLAFTIVN